MTRVVAIAVIATLLALSFVQGIELTKESFQSIVRQPGKKAVVQFTGPWCSNCKSLTPAWDAITRAYERSKDLVVGTVDCTAHPDLCNEYGVLTYPTIKYFTSEKPKGELYTGGHTLENIKDYLQQKLGSSQEYVQDTVGSSKEYIQQKAAESQKNIQEKVGQAKDTVQGTVGQAKETIGQAKDTVQGKVGEAQQNIRTKLGESQQNIQEQVENVRGKVGETQQNLQQKVGQAQENVRGKVGETQQNLQQKVGEAQENVRGKVGETQQNLQKKAESSKGFMQNTKEYIQEKLGMKPGCNVLNRESCGWRELDFMDSMKGQTKSALQTQKDNLQQMLDNNKKMASDAALWVRTRISILQSLIEQATG